MSKNQQYAEKYAAEAMEQMKRYGIPASVTLAQGILESSNGQSELSQLGNNHFGVKASGSWLKNGGDYLVYTDDKPNEKFCKYATVGDSYEHHSKILKNSSRYSQCFKLSPDDYKGWTKGIERGGYATNGGYAASLQKIIEANGLQKYDQQVMKEMRAEACEEIFVDTIDILRMWAKIAFADMNDYVNVSAAGVMLRGSNQTDGQVITEIKEGKDGITIKMADKMKALDRLSSYLRILPEDQAKDAKLRILQKAASEDSDDEPLKIEIVGV